MRSENKLTGAIPADRFASSWDGFSALLDTRSAERMQ